MRRILGAVAVAAIACGSSGSKGGGADEARSNLERDMTPDVPLADQQELVAGNTAFAVEAYRQMTAGSTANLAFSPHSLSLALAMAFADRCS